MLLAPPPPPPPPLQFTCRARRVPHLQGVAKASKGAAKPLAASNAGGKSIEETYQKLSQVRAPCAARGHLPARLPRLSACPHCSGAHLLAARPCIGPAPRTNRNTDASFSTPLVPPPQLEHILLRPDTYIGSTEKQAQQLWVHDGERMAFKAVTFAPGLYKIFDEILVNASDNKVRDASMDTLRVDIDPVRGGGWRGAEGGRGRLVEGGRSRESSSDARQGRWMGLEEPLGVCVFPQQLHAHA